MRYLLLALALSLPALSAWCRPATTTTLDEFVGPFPSWMNVKTDFGAVGDGKADDTAAIQKALDAIKSANSPKRVLYFPDGTYRITNTLQLTRASHNEPNGIAIYGEDPEQTAIVWDGPAGGSMLQYNPWYAVMGRLTFDGQRKAKTAIDFYGSFSTCNELSDLLIKDAQFGIEVGHMDSAGIAETSVLRCRFYRCAQAAVSVQNFNSLDWYIWHGYFEDCGIGVTNRFGAGNFHVYESVFRGSTQADVMIKHCGYFTLYGNTSIDAKAFFVSIRAENWKDSETWGANVTLQKNTIYQPKDASYIRIANNGPTMLLDNVLPSVTPGTPVVVNVPSTEQADVISVGNLFSAPQPYQVKGRLTTLDDRYDSPVAKLRSPFPPSPFLPHATRPVIEVKAGADAATIQQAIAQAAAMPGQRPIVHLPAGNYQLKQTLVIPAHSDLQLVGDGLIQATSLSWNGAGDGPALRIAGPSHATLRNFEIRAGKTARALVADGVDQPGGRIYMEQGQSEGYEYGLVVDGLDQTAVVLHDHGHNGMKVVGGPAAAQGKRPTGMTTLFCGASSRDKGSQDAGVDLYNVDNGGRLLVRDIWYEGHIWHFLHLTGTGEFTYHAGIVAPYTPPSPEDAVMLLDNFRGKLTLSQIEPCNGAFRINGGNQDTKVLGLGMIMRQMPMQFEHANPAAKIACLHGRLFRENGTGTDSLPDVGAADPAFLRDMLQPLRTMLPQPLTTLDDHLTDLRIYRVRANGKEGMRLTGTPLP